MADCVSVKMPTPADKRRTKEMLNTLRDFGVFGGQPEELRRLAVLQKLKELYGLWLEEISKLQKVPYSTEGQVYSFGSFQLGAYDKDADMDTLFIAPQHVTRRDFFTSFLEKLKKTKGVKDVIALENCYLPIIKLYFDGIKFDLVFVTLGLKTISETFDPTDDEVLKGLNAKDTRCLLGYRVMQWIVHNLPCFESFTLALRAIKLWAKRRHIYCHAVGFLGGGAWTILVAQICQMYPKADASTLVHKFFLVYSMWKWPTPVFLKPPDTLDLGLPVWDPRVHARDRNHLMPILSPVYPQQNCAYNVTASSRAIVMDELKRGLTITNEIMNNKANWDRLLRATDFFGQYKHYIVVEARAATAEKHLEWTSFVQSRLRLIVGRLDANKCVSLAHVNPKPWSGLLKDANKKDLSSMWAIGVHFQKSLHPRKKRADFCSLSQDLLAFADIIRTHAMNVGMHQAGESFAQQMSRCDLHWLLHDVKGIEDRPNRTNRQRHTSGRSQPSQTRPVPVRTRQPAMDGPDRPHRTPRCPSAPSTAPSGSNQLKGPLGFYNKREGQIHVPRCE